MLMFRSCLHMSPAVFIHVYLHTDTCVFFFMHVHMYIRIWMYRRMYMYTQASLHAHAHICIGAHIECISAYTYRMDWHTYVYTHASYIYGIYLYTYMQMMVLLVMLLSLERPNASLLAMVCDCPNFTAGKKINSMPLWTLTFAAPRSRQLCNLAAPPTLASASSRRQPLAPQCKLTVCVCCQMTCCQTAG